MPAWFPLAVAEVAPLLIGPLVAQDMLLLLPVLAAAVAVVMAAKLLLDFLDWQTLAAEVVAALCISILSLAVLAVLAS